MRVFLIILLASVAPLVAADSGVLVPAGRTAPDPETLSLGEMFIDIGIDNGMARVAIREIFLNHTGGNLEGTFEFALPTRAVLSGFAVWDDLVRIPGVIMERRRAGEIYDSLRPLTLDPGILQMGERSAEEAALNSQFTARVMPIPARGTKRIELEYHERILIEGLAGVLAVPLEPDVYQTQVAGRLDIRLRVDSDRPIDTFDAIGESYPLTIEERTANHIQASFSATDVELSDDFAIRYSLSPSEADTLRLTTYRDPAEGAAPGFFQVSALFGEEDAGAPADPAPRTLIAVFDSSLSMQWNKLESSFRAFESLMRSLGPEDRFNVVVFNSDVAALSPVPEPATLDAVEDGLLFVRQSRLRGSTDLGRALDVALDQAEAAGDDTTIVVFSDGGSTAGPVANTRLVRSFFDRWNSIDEGQRPRMFVFGVGDDANLPVLTQIGAADGVFEWVRSTEPIEFKVDQFISKIGRFPIDGLDLSASPAASIDRVYALEPAVFGGSEQVWIGQYPEPRESVTLTSRARRAGEEVVLTATAPLPVESTEHASLPRTWAKARVDFLLAQIERNGEDRASIEEIIDLSRRYTFVTPYTSFLAAPRSLLRPRVIRPGDPILRVETDPAITSVIAVFPFGLIKPLRYLDEERVWQTRFLAPVDMPDGSHSVEIVMRDAVGNAYTETKTFVIASRPPVVRVRLDRDQYRSGDTVRLSVGASETTRTIVARMYGVAPVDVRWNPEARSNTGEFRIPDDLPPGEYRLAVTAEDFAHNVGTAEVTLAVVP